MTMRVGLYNRRMRFWRSLLLVCGVVWCGVGGMVSLRSNCCWTRLEERQGNRGKERRGTLKRLKRHKPCAYGLGRLGLWEFSPR